MATNHKIIFEEANLRGYEYDGTNLKTFNEWKKAGYSVKKGEKAFIKVGLWKPVITKEKDKKTGEEVEVRKFILKTSHLFKPDQVKPLKESKTKADTKKTTKKTTSKTTKTATKKATAKKKDEPKEKPKQTPKAVSKAFSIIDEETENLINQAFDELGI